MKLNVGCGTNRSYPFKDLACNVNCDLEKPLGFHPQGFVQCDVRYLPFNSKTFEISFAFHVLEHVPDPVLMIKELIRVTKSLIILKTPHRFSPDSKLDRKHLNIFTVSYFRKILKNYNYYIDSSKGWILPHEIIVTIML